MKANLSANYSNRKITKRKLYAKSSKKYLVAVIISRLLRRKPQEIGLHE